MIAVFLLSFVHLALAGDTNPLSKAELTQRLQRYQSIQGLEASFKQTKTLKDMDVVIKSEGHFTLTRPRKVRWEIVKPSPVLISMDDSGVSIQTGVGPNINTQNFKLDDLPSGKIAHSLTGLMVWLDLNANELFEHYTVFSEAKDQFKFIPKEKDSLPFRSLVMSLDSTGYVHKILITENSNDAIEIEFGIPKIVSKKK